MQVLRVRLNQGHIAEAKRSGSENPLVEAIGESTGCQWHMSECGSGIEAAPPYRQFLLEGDILNLWRLYRATGEIAPCAFYLGLHDIPPAQQYFPLQAENSQDKSNRAPANQSERTLSSEAGGNQ